MYRVTVAGGITIGRPRNLTDAATLINQQRCPVYVRQVGAAAEMGDLYSKSARVDPRDGSIVYAVHGTELDERGVQMYGAWAEPLRRALAITNPRFERTEQGDPDGTDQDQGGRQAVA